jgi:hypothetical protein
MVKGMKYNVTIICAFWISLTFQYWELYILFCEIYTHWCAGGERLCTSSHESYFNTSIIKFVLTDMFLSL